jgi:hypothetical protein
MHSSAFLLFTSKKNKSSFVVSTNNKEAKTMSSSYPRMISLPPGKVGLGFKGTPAIIKTIAEDCPIRDQVKVGDQVVQFTCLSSKCEIAGLKIPSTFLGENLKQFAKCEDRVICIMDDAALAKPQPEAPSELPNGKNVVPGGTWWKRYRDMADSVNLGSEGSEGGASFASVPIYKEPGENGRWLNIYGSQTRPGDEEYPYAIASQAGRMDCTYKAWLPAGKVGVSFKKQPPIVSKVSDSSPLAGIVKIGQQIVECSIDDEIVMEGDNLSFDSVGQFLMDNADNPGRSIKLTVKADNLSSSSRSLVGPPVAATPPLAAAPAPVATAPAAAAAVTAAAVATTAAAEPDPIPPTVETYTVSLPEGVAGLSFKGVPCRISRVSPDGPMVAAGIVLGQQIVACGVSGKVLLSGNNLTSTEVGHFLRENAKAGSERFLTLTVDSDTVFAEQVMNARSSVIAPAMKFEYALPPGAAKGGKWLYKEPGLLGRVVTKTGAPVVYGFTLLVEI